MLYAESRQLHGSTNFRRPCRFLKEIPPELINSDTLLNSAEPTSDQAGTEFLSADLQLNTDVCGFSLGQRVRHKTFGEGNIIGFEGQGEFMLVQVKFKREGIKWLSPQYAQIEIV